MNTPRYHSHTRSLLAIAAAAIPAMLIGASVFAPSARAAFIMTLEQQGTSVVATGSGTIDITDLSFFTNGHQGDVFIEANLASIAIGPLGGSSFDDYRALTGPANFGSGGFTPASSGLGDFVWLNTNGTGIAVPAGYVSGSALSDSATWDNATFSSLGVNTGTYEWTWGSGADADSFTLQIGAVPAPPIGRGLPVLLAVGGVLFGAKLLERGKRPGLQSG